MSFLRRVVVFCEVHSCFHSTPSTDPTQLPKNIQRRGMALEQARIDRLAKYLPVTHVARSCGSKTGPLGAPDQTGASRGPVAAQPPPLSPPYRVHFHQHEHLLPLYCCHKRGPIQLESFPRPTGSARVLHKGVGMPSSVDAVLCMSKASSTPAAAIAHIWDKYLYLMWVKRGVSARTRHW